MSDRRTPPFDDGDVTPPRGVGATAGSPAYDDIDRLDDEWDDEEWDEPNYLIRRALIVLFAVAVIAIAAFVILRFIGGDDNDDAAIAGAEWNVVVAVTEDGVSLFDDSGEDIDTIDAASKTQLDDQVEVAGDTLIALDDDGRVTLTDLTDGSRRTGRAAADATMTMSDVNPLLALVETPGGGDVSIIDTVGSDVVSIADATNLTDPTIFGDDVLVNASGTHAAAPVPRLFQSFVIDLDTETSIALAGRVIAIDDERVVTEQPAGASSEIEFYDLTGNRLGSVDVASPVAYMLRADGAMLLVAGDGTITEATPDGTDDLGELTDAEGGPIEVTGGTSALDGERLIVVGSEQVVVVDADGSQLGVSDGTLAISAQRASRCISVHAGRGNADLRLIELETATVIGQSPRGNVVARSVGGCTIATSGGTAPQIVSAEPLVDVDADSVVAVAPDGSAYVVVDGRDTEFVTIDGDDDDDTIELVDEPTIIRFGTR